MDNKKWLAGEIVPETATYKSYDRHCKCDSSSRLEKGSRFPATQLKDSYYCLECCNCEEC